ncbi:MAG: hypothetical protein K8S27_04775 [Candidatus Omnitrophica bacterium]|nr:hypothetical protein [Candidatus Omnitrophota bacterium]
MLFVDGGISYPSILAKVLPAQNIVCLYIPPDESRRQWEQAEARKPMKDMIFDCPPQKRSGDLNIKTFF